MEHVLSSIRYARPYGFLDKSIQFVLVYLPGEPLFTELEKVADCAQTTNMRAKLNLVCAHTGPGSARVIADLNHLGLHAMHGQVGAQCRLGDLVRHPGNGFVLDGDLVDDAVGDPGAASILESLTGLARNLGVKTFASRVSGVPALALLEHLGVDYVSLNQKEEVSICVREEHALS